MSKKKFYTSLPEHSQAKVRLLRTYLDRYLRILGNMNTTHEIRIYDLFCGQGLYENGQIGSPLIITDAILSFYGESSVYNWNFPKFTLHFNDFDEEKISILERVVTERYRDYQTMVEFFFTQENYLDKIEKVKKEVSVSNPYHCKSFLFIDPTGYREIKINDIEQLMENRSTELLLFLPIQHMYRFKDNGTPEILVDFITELDIQDVRMDYERQFIDEIKNGFKQRLRGTFVDTFIIEKDSKTSFCLFFFSNHIKGFEKMLEAKWELDVEYGKGFTYEKSGTLFSAHKLNHLEELLVNFLDTPKTNEQIYEFVLRNGYLPKHALEVLSSLIDEGRLNKLFSINGLPPSRNAFYINYDTFNEPKPENLVTFTLKKS